MSVTPNAQGRDTDFAKPSKAISGYNREIIKRVNEEIEMTQTQQSQTQPVNMYLWRLNRVETEKRAEDVNRQILRRQHSN